MRRRGVLLVAGIAALAAAAPAHAATTYKVSGTADGAGACADGVCTTLRAALAAAKAGDTISLPTPKPATDVYQANSQLLIGSSVTIKGSGAQNVTIKGGGKGRVFSVGPDQTVTISGVEVSSGTALAESDKRGGNILVGQGAALTLDHVRVTLGTALRGGGIAALGATKLTIQQSLVDTNTAGSASAGGDGGGLISIGDAKLARNEVRISDSTIARNTASTAPGISLRDNPANVTQIDRSTIAYNTAGSNGGSGVYTSDAEKVTIGSSILAGNTGDGTQDNCTPGATIVSTGGNIEDRGDKCGFAAPADKPDTAALIATELTMDGGQTPVLPFSPRGSPGIDFAPLCVGADQRDIARPQGKSCDSGAYELDQAPDVTIDDGPSGLIRTGNVEFRFSSQEPGVSFECRLDGPGGAVGSFAACATPKAYSLADGDYQFLVRANDGANTSPAASHTFTVDTTAPAAPAFTAPAEGTAQKSRTINLTGTGELFATITVREGSAVKGTAQVGQTGTWSLQLTSVPDGLHTYTATATDGAGNTSGATTLHITVDNVAPAAPTVSSPADNALVNTATPTLTGTAEGNTTITIREGMTVRGTGSAVAGGAWSVQLSTLSEGSRALSITATDAATNESTATTRTIRVDTIKPAAPTVSSPAENAFVKTGTPTLTGTTEGSATITVTEGAAARGTGTATGGGAWSVQLAALSEGSHMLTVTAKDAATNESDPTTRTIRVDTTPPVTTLDTAGLPTRVNGAISFTFSANEAGSTFRCRLDTPAGAGTFSACSSPKGYTGLTAGNYRFHVFASDPATNDDPTDATFDFMVDTTPPGAPVVSLPAENASVNTPTPTFSGTAEGNATITIKEGAVVRGTTTAAPGGAWSVQLSTLAEGSRTLSVTATDAASNASDPTTRTIRIDTVRPDPPTVSSPADNALLKTATPTLSGTAEGNATITIKEAAVVRGSGTAAPGGAWSVQLSSLGEGSHNLSVTATDAATNASDPTTRTIRVDTVRPGAPTISSPADNALVKTATPTLTGTAEGNTTITIREGTTVRDTGSAAAGGGWSIVLSTLGEGSHSLSVTATDLATNESDPTTRVIRVDTIKPAAPVVSSPGEGSLLNSHTVSLSGTAESGATVKVLEGATLKGSTTATGGNWTLTVTGAADGAHTYTVTATDAAGNESGATARQVLIDTGPPDAPAIVAPAEGALINGAGFAVSGSAEPGATVELFEGGVSRGTAVAHGGQWAIDLAGVADGAHAYAARATDVAGNVSGDSPLRTVTVDTTAPAAAVTGGPNGPTTDSAPAFPFSSPDAASVFDCRLDGPSGPGTYQPCVSPKSFSGLAPGAYTFFLRATDPAGNQSVTTRSFTVTLPQQAMQTPTPTFQQSVVVQPAGGKVLVKRKGTKTFVALDATQGIPLGSEVDTRHGKVRLSSVPSKAGKVQTALFYAGLFVVTQVGGITNLRLSEPLARCPTAKASIAAKKKKPKSRRLWGDGSGAFRTQGRYSAATVRGTKWLVQDTCAGTLTRVARGVVQVDDRVRHKQLVLRKGKSYTARPKRR